MKTVLWILFSVLVQVYSEQCPYQRYLSSVVPDFLKRDNRTVIYSSVNEAKSACDGEEFGDVCTSVVLSLTQERRSYVLASSEDLYYTKNAISWVKSCPGDCTFRLTNSKVYDRVCLKTAASNQGWLQWSNWSRCSESCGHLGTQERYRICRVGKCSGNRREINSCNYGKECPLTLADAFGVSGPEGVDVAGSTFIYRSCIRTEERDRRNCGEQRGITEESCNQFGCCFQRRTEEGFPPRCFHASNVFGGLGIRGWSIWSPWSRCSNTCGPGARNRLRVCTSGVIGSTLCPGSQSETQECSYGACPCDVSPCNNGGVCVPDGSIARSYRCDCSQNFIGRHCDYGQPSLACGNDFISIAFDRRIVPEEGLIDDVTYIHFQGFRERECFARADGSGKYLLSIPAPIDSSCGSTVEVTEDEYTIRNKVLWRLSEARATSTVVLLDLTCVYSKTLNMSAGLDFGIRPTVRTLSVQRQTGGFPLTMTLYRDANFSPNQRFLEAPRIAEGEILYVSVDFERISLSSFESEVLVLDRCYATDTTDQRRPLFDFITDGCSTNPAFTTILENGVSASGRWGFRVFEWATQSETSDIFIVCTAYVCDNRIETCVPSCDQITPTTTPPDDVNELDIILFGDLLNSIATNSTSRRKRRDVIEGSRVFATKRISVVKPMPDNNVLARMSDHRMMTSQSKRSSGNSLNVVSMFLAGTGSVFVYVTILSLIKRRKIKYREF